MLSSPERLKLERARAKKAKVVAGARETATSNMTYVGQLVERFKQIHTEWLKEMKDLKTKDLNEGTVESLQKTYADTIRSGRWALRLIQRIARAEKINVQINRETDSTIFEALNTEFRVKLNKEAKLELKQF